MSSTASSQESSTGVEAPEVHVDVDTLELEQAQQTDGKGRATPVPHLSPVSESAIFSPRSAGLTPRASARASAAAVLKSARKLSAIPRSVGSGIANTFSDAADGLLEFIDGPAPARPSRGPLPPTDPAKIDALWAEYCREREKKAATGGSSTSPDGHSLNA